MPPHVWPHLLVVLLLPGVALKSHWHYLVCPDYAAVLCLAHGGLIFIKSWMGNTFLMWVVRLYCMERRCGLEICGPMPLHVLEHFLLLDCVSDKYPFGGMFASGDARPRRFQPVNWGGLKKSINRIKL